MPGPDPDIAQLRAEAAAMAQGALVVADAIRTRDSHWTFVWRLATVALLLLLVLFAWDAQQTARRALRASSDNNEILRFQRDVLEPVLCEAYAQRGTPPPPALDCP